MFLICYKLFGNHCFTLQSSQVKFMILIHVYFERISNNLLLFDYLISFVMRISCGGQSIVIACDKTSSKCCQFNNMSN